MNFFGSGDVAASAGSILGREVAANEQVGLRPEHLVPVDEGSAVVSGQWDLIENLGEYALVHLTTSTGVEFIAKTEKPPVQAKGETIHFGIKPELAHFFDRESGLRR
jgi:multiple sugar transport system ATP-binding protein/alpha-glucoside transport system ATP-binding protein